MTFKQFSLERMRIRTQFQLWGHSSEKKKKYSFLQWLNYKGSSRVISVCPGISILGDVCHTPHPSPGIPTQSKVMLHRTIIRKIIVYAIKQRKNVLFMFTLWRTCKFIPHSGTRGGWMDPPRGFDMLQYFETILPSKESLWSSLQDEVHFMGGGNGRHLGFYQELSIRSKPREMVTFCAWDEK